jgi:3-hydroxyacyl-CoA dehydrogenase / enoyl-CoA hydratase / 3-hydroxybutyryl-CoA epimerase
VKDVMMIKTAFESDTGIAVITWDAPDSPVNVKNRAAIAAFSAAVADAIGNSAVKGVIIASAKKDFISGGDLDELRQARTPAEAGALVRDIGQCLRRFETSGKPFVAALNGSAMGGGLEVALACHHRIAVDDPALRLAFPEVTLGLIPGAGGTQRLPRLIGIAASMPLLMEGRPVNGQEALKIGLVDEIVDRTALMEAARRWILSAPEPVQPWDRKDYALPGFHPQSPEGRNFFSAAWPALRRKTMTADIAPAAILQVLHHGLERGIDAGLRIEAMHFATVASSRSAKNKIRTQYYAANAARNLKARPKDVARFEPRRAGVIGAGLMGNGIAYCLARAGVAVMLVDVSEERLEKARDQLHRNGLKSVERGALSQAKLDKLMSLIATTTDIAGLAGCDAVFEAVVEIETVKHDVIARAAAVLPSDALVATNTSTLPIADLAGASSNPDNFIGMHFFAPVDRMPLLEIIRGPQTSDVTLARALDVAKLMGKTPIVVRDGLGFFTSRVVASYTREALLLLSEGVPPQIVDNAALAAGMPIGPLAMADQTSLDLLHNILGSVAGPNREADHHARALEVLHRFSGRLGRPGRKASAGIYDYGADGSRAVWSGLPSEYPPVGDRPGVPEIQRRLLHIQAIETIGAMQDGIIASASDADLGSVLGWSFPAYHGGVLSYVDGIGAGPFVEECNALAKTCGERFAPPPNLIAMAAGRKRFHEL